MSNISKFGVGETSAPSTLSGEPAPSAQANSPSEPTKRTRSSLADELNVKAVDALDTAGKMPLGDARTAAMRRATILGNAAELIKHLAGKAGAPENDG